MITFTNPHIAGQKLRVKVPPNVSPNGMFKVTVPIPSDGVGDLDNNANDDKDYNRISGTFYDLLESFARAYDEWCDAEGDFHKIKGEKEFAAHFEKRNKFDKLINEFPSNLKTVDKAYLQKFCAEPGKTKASGSKHWPAIINNPPPMMMTTPTTTKIATPATVKKTTMFQKSHRKGNPL